MKWLRFSLRTLVLFALLLGSAATLWWNWGPWVVERRLPTEGAVSYAYFSNDDRYVIATTTTDDAKECGAEVFDAQSGRLLHRIRVPLQKKPSFPLVVFEQGELLHFCLVNLRYGPDALFRIDTGKPVEVPWRNEDERKTGRIRFHGDILELSVGNEYRFKDNWYKRWVRKADFTPLPEWLNGLNLSPGGRYALPAEESSGEIRLVSSNEIVARLPTRKNWRWDWYTDNILHATVSDNGTDSYEIWSLYPPRRLCGSALKDVEYCAQTGQAIVWDAQGVAYLTTPEKGNSISLGPAEFARFSETGRWIQTDKPARVYDGTTGAMLWQPADPPQAVYQISNGYALLVTAGQSKGSPPSASELRDAATGIPVFKITPGSWSTPDSNAISMEFAHRSDRFLTFTETFSNTPSGRHDVMLWKRNRPWQWYGPAYLPEFWITVVFGFAFVWSLWRDRRILRARA